MSNHPSLPACAAPTARPRDARRCVKAASVSVMLNAALMTLQIVVGLSAGSDGLVADGIHTFSDLAADGLVLAVLYLRSTRRGGDAADASDTADASGDALVSLFISLLLIATAGQMLWHGINEAMSNAPSDAVAPNAVALFAALGAIGAKEWLFRFLRRESRRAGSDALMASAWHARVDAISAGVAMLGIAGSLAGMPMLDPVAAAVIGLLILRMGGQTAWSAVKAMRPDRLRPLETAARRS